MGQEITTGRFSPRDFDEFRRRLEAETATLRELVAAFNIELNGKPVPLSGRAFSHLHDQLLATWQRCQDHAADMGLDVLAVGTDVSSEYFRRDGGLIRPRRAVVPAMYTNNAAAVRQDCLCYFLAPVSLPGATPQS